MMRNANDHYMMILFYHSSCRLCVKPRRVVDRKASLDPFHVYEPAKQTPFRAIDSFFIHKLERLF